MMDELTHRLLQKKYAQYDHVVYKKGEYESPICIIADPPRVVDGELRYSLQLLSGAPNPPWLPDEVSGDELEPAGKRNEGSGHETQPPDQHNEPPGQKR